MGETKTPRKHIVLTSHPSGSAVKPPAIAWAAATVAARGPIVGTVTNPAHRNVIGTHAGSYALYRALAVASGGLRRDHVSDLTDTSPAVEIGPHPQWAVDDKIVSLDPYGHLVSEAFADLRASGWDIRPTIAVTRGRLGLADLRESVRADALKPDGRILTQSGEVNAIKIAIEPVWYLPGIARRFGIAETALRRTLFEQTGGMFPELVTRRDLSVFLPPIGGHTVYVFGDLAKLGDPATKVACRVHDECNGSDVFGSDICTCRPYLVHGIEVCIETAQRGGAGIIVYNRKEGRALGEVTKFLVYNARKRQREGDRAEAYFERTECVAGVQDMRFQELMPDVMHWLGIGRIDKFVSMSNMKRDALARQGIEIAAQVAIPEDRIPPDAMVEIDAKKAAGYYSAGDGPGPEDLAVVKGRSLADY